MMPGHEGSALIQERQEVEVRWRNNKDLTLAYSGVAAAARRVADAAVLDGEVVAFPDVKRANQL
jgi:ATP-dependent DNA ligase